MSKKGSITTSDYLPYEEYEKLVDCLEKDKKYKEAAYCVVSFAFALRVSDVRMLKWNQVLGPRNIVVTEKKTGKTKSIPIGSNTSAHLQKLFKLTHSKTTDAYIIANQFDGSPISKQYLNRLLKACKEKYSLNIENFSTHTFRKTFGRYVYNKMGKTQEAIILLNRIFRHGSINTTMVYLGLKDDEIGQIFEGL